MRVDSALEAEIMNMRMAVFEGKVQKAGWGASERYTWKVARVGRARVVDRSVPCSLAAWLTDDPPRIAPAKRESKRETQVQGVSHPGPNCSGNGEIPSEEELTSHQSGNRDETNDAHLIHRGKLSTSSNRPRGVCQLCDLHP